MISFGFHLLARLLGDLVHVEQLVFLAHAVGTTLNHLPDMLTGEPCVRWPPN